MERLTLEIVTPERKVLTKEVDEVTLPGLQGELGILPGHTELLTVLRPGRLLFKDGSTAGTYAVAGGFCEVGHTKVIVLADAAEAQAEIDVERAKTALTRAQQQLSDLEVSNENFAACEAAVARATARLEVAGKPH